MSKYRNVRTLYDGHWFDSAKEAARYRELQLLEKAGEIHDLRLQPRFELNAAAGSLRTPTGAHRKVGEYRADFAYTDTLGAHVVEDVKGFKTPLYRWKAKHMAAQYGIQVRET